MTEEDIKLVQQYFKVNEARAKDLIEKGINLDFLRNGPETYLKGELDKVGNKFQSKVESMVKEELSSSD